MQLLALIDDSGDGLGGQLIDKWLDFVCLADSLFIIVVFFKTFGVDFGEFFDFVECVYLLFDEYVPVVNVHLKKNVSEVDMKVQITLVPSGVIEVDHFILILHAD